MRFPPGFNALNHREYQLYFSGQTISLIGTWMQSLGQSWLILDLTNSAFKLGLINALQFTPVLFLALAAGALVDRLPKRRLIIATQTVYCMLALVLSVLVYTGRVQYWHVAVLAALLGVCNALDAPARQAFVVAMVGKEDVANAVALNAVLFNVGRVLGPAVAGLLIARYGVALAFLLNGISFVAVIIALLAMRIDGMPEARGATRIYQEIREGLDYAWHNPRISLVLSLLLAVAIFVINFNVLVPLLAKDVLHEGAAGFGLLMAALGMGALMGALSMALTGRSQPSLPVVIGAGVLLCIASVAMGFITHTGLAAVMLFVMGFTQVNFSVGCNTTVQTTASDNLRGRAMSLYVLVFVGVGPLGAFFSGGVAEAFGTPAGFLWGGGVGLLLMLLVLAWRRPWARAVPSLKA